MSRTRPLMDAETARAALVETLTAQGILHDSRVRQALLAVPREAFTPESPYTDAPQPIGAGQTISAPHMVAMMAEALDVRPGHRVLEVGGGSGYHAAVLAHLARPNGRVITIEIIPRLARAARDVYETLGIRDVEVVEADGSAGHPAAAPYDRISVAADAPRIPPPLLDQLTPDGILVIPVNGMLLRVDRSGHQTPLCGVRFVPLRGAFGHP